MTERQKELVALVNKYATEEGVNETRIPGLSLFKASELSAPVPTVYNPCLCIIIQGEKQVTLDKEMYHYKASQYLTVSVNLPLINKITAASKTLPYLLVKIDIDLLQLSELLTHITTSISPSMQTRRGIFIGKVNETMCDNIFRLLRLLENPEHIPILAAQTLREIFYRTLCSDYGDIIAQIALKGSHMQSIANSILKIKSDFREPITMEELAKIACMSVSSFHAHFKSVTSMSPLQFQKSLRLIEARSLMSASEMDAAHAAYKVGYQSASQFNREYARMFGNPPGKDINSFRQLRNKG